MTQSPDGVYGCGSEGAADVLKRALSRRGIPTAHRWTSCETSASYSRPCGVSSSPGQPSRTPCWHTKVLCGRSGDVWSICLHAPHLPRSPGMGVVEAIVTGQFFLPDGRRGASEGAWGEHLQSRCNRYTADLRHSDCHRCFSPSPAPRLLIGWACCLCLSALVLATGLPPVSSHVSPPVWRS